MEPTIQLIRPILLLACLALPLAPSLAIAQQVTRVAVSAADEIQAALYQASATAAAFKKWAGRELQAQRDEIEELRLQVTLGVANGQALTGLRAKLAASQAQFIKELKAHDPAYSTEIETLRAAVEDIAASPEGLRALALFNYGDEVGALAILDDLRAAHDRAQEARVAFEAMRARVESAAEARRIATLALEARTKGKVSTAEVIARYEEIVALDGLFEDWVELGRLRFAAGNLKGAFWAAEAALEAAGDERSRSVAYNEIGNVQVAKGDLDAALTSYRRSLEIAETRAAEDSSDTGRLYDLSVSLGGIGDVEVARGDLDAALTSYRRSLEIAETLSAADPGNAGWQRDLSVSLNKIGDVEVARGDLDTALTRYRRSLEIAETLAAADPGNAGWQRDLSVSLNKIGDVEVARGDLDAALTSYRGSLEIAETLAETDPGNVGWQRDLSVWLMKIGDVKVDRGDLDTALTSYRRSLQIRETLATADPSNARWQRDLWVSVIKIGDVELAREDLDAALTNYGRSLEISETLAAADPGNAGWQRDLSASLEKIGEAEVAGGDLDAALTYYRRSLEIAETLAEADPGNAEWQRDLWVSMSKLRQFPSMGITWSDIVAKMETMAANGTLLPTDRQYLDHARAQAALE